VQGLADEERLRAGHYRLLARVLAAPPDQALLDLVAGLEGEGIVNALAAAARETSPAKVEREFHNLFIGVGEGELVPYASYYLTGFLYERPLARLRDDLRRLGVARADGVAEPEDGIAGLCEVMAGLIEGAFETAPLARQRDFFDRHLAPWAGRFFADLEHAPSASFYRRVGSLGRAFIDVEIQAFELMT
jgi:TorA maturation chaperone TorD